MPEKIVFVSGCYDVLHGGHVEFFEQARSLGDRLVVCFAGDESLRRHKRPQPSIPTIHKLHLLSALRPVDEVVIGDDLEAPHGLDFKKAFLSIRPQILAVTEDDKYGAVKRELCAEVGAEYVVMPKSLQYEKTSTTDILRRIKAPAWAPLRIDFAGGWLDVPKYARPGAFVVNCSISPQVSLADWPYHIGGGLGGSAAYALLQGRDSVQSELDLGVGWQDPAIISETGLCVWRSGQRPELDFKTSPAFLSGKMAVLWTGSPHTTYALTDLQRDWSLIKAAGAQAREAVLPDRQSFVNLAEAVDMSYQVQQGEGMQPLPDHGQLAAKYLGGGFGGYALYLFISQAQRDAFVEAQGGRGKDGAIAIEPYIRPAC